VLEQFNTLKQYNTNVLSLDFETAYWIVHQFEMRCLKTNFIADLRGKKHFRVVFFTWLGLSCVLCLHCCNKEKY